jgi:hypothetical protein
MNSINNAPAAPATAGYCSRTLATYWPAADSEADAPDNALAGMREECAEVGDEPENEAAFLMKDTTLVALSAVGLVAYRAHGFARVRKWPATGSRLLESKAERDAAVAA